MEPLLAAPRPRVQPCALVVACGRRWLLERFRSQPVMVMSWRSSRVGRLPGHLLAIPAAALQSPVGQAASSKLQSPPLACRKRLVPRPTRSVCVSTCWRTCGGSLGRPTLRPFPTWWAADPAVMPAPDVITIERGGERCFIIMCVRLKKSFFLHLLVEPTRCELRGLANRATNLTIPKQVGSGSVLPRILR